MQNQCYNNIINVNQIYCKIEFFFKIIIYIKNIFYSLVLVNKLVIERFMYCNL